ncbi:hypothetical protein [Pseudoteredinibacter isoporae]|uniref:Uncharacterized protein n=1 Tax=Pseudoteredinibacter isoporae TaxID=570281 RepID=A0A7X0JUE8_9GAMM|nr:hypothetical protein [Pseudoteredinibacter isoporae]MBB6521576.1 hypothetical protein [Pseudoteredinibacter isoporae]NHO87130.1 hypothetical protein [Pseudoteredinibacter isoporae]NIB22954.1 hypothetical protein [Pseudoteredinibacter isoporae]
MSIGIVFVILAIAMVLGPVMLMKPSGRQRQLARLRQEALENGLQSRISSVPKELGSYTAAPTIAVYQKRWLDRRYTGTETLMLYRTAYSHDIHFHGVWDWQEGVTMSSMPNEALKNNLDALPDSVLAVEISTLGVGLFWLEKGCSVETLSSFYPAIMNWVEEQGMLEKNVETAS